MGKLIVTEFMTLDGVAQSPGGREEDREEGFDHGGWQGPYMQEDDGDLLFQQAAKMDALLLGRKTYDNFSGYWPTAPEMPWTELMNRVPKYVASSTLSEPLSWAGTTLLTGDLAAGVTALKEKHEQLHVIGSLDLLQSLLTHGLVDELNLWVYALVLGTGKRVFADGTVPASLRLAESQTYEMGTVHLRYELVGPPTYRDHEL